MIPAARITLDGIDITANLIPSPFGVPLEGGGMAIASGALSGGPLLSITVTDNEGTKSDSVELEIDNRSQIPAPKKGAKMKVWLGYADSGLVYMGTFMVDTWTKKGRPLTMTVSAKAAGLTTDIKAPKSRSYHDKKVEEIVKQVAGKNKLGSKVHPDLGKIKIGHIDQQNESDLNFLTRLGKRVGANFKLADENVIFNKAGAGQLPSGGDAPTFTITETGVTDWSATGSERGSYKSSSASWQNTTKGERETITEGEGTPRYRDRKLYKTEDEARAAAKATLEGLKRGKVSFDANFPGKPEMFAGAKVQAQDFDPDVDMLYILKTATHKLDSSGLSTGIKCESKSGGEDEEGKGESKGGGDSSSDE